MKFLILNFFLATELCTNNAFGFAFTSQNALQTRYGTYAHSLRSTTDAIKETGIDDAFSAFSESIDEDNLFNDEDDAPGSEDESTSWQESLEMFLDPGTPSAKRQILLSDLVNANDVIRNDLQSALKERKVSEIYRFLSGLLNAGRCVLI